MNPNLRRILERPIDEPVDNEAAEEAPAVASRTLVINEGKCSGCGSTTSQCSCRTNNVESVPANDHPDIGPSRRAAGKSLMLGHVPSRKHALEAFDSANRGNSKDAERSHLKAVKHHEAAAEEAEEEGQLDVARQHRSAARHHKKAAVHHAIIARTGSPDSITSTDEDEMTTNRRNSGLPPLMTLEELVCNYDDYGRSVSGPVRNQSPPSMFRYEGSSDPKDGLPLPVLNFDNDDNVPSFAFTQPSQMRGLPAPNPQYGQAPPVRSMRQIMVDGMSDDELEEENRRRQGLPQEDQSPPRRTIAEIASASVNRGAAMELPRMDWNSDWPGESVPKHNSYRQQS